MIEVIDNIDFIIIAHLNAAIFIYPIFGYIVYFLARFLIIIFIGCVIYLWFDRRYGGIVENRKVVILAICALIVGFAIDLIIGFIFLRPRPFAAHPEFVRNIGLFVGEPSFPSSHAVSVFAIALTVLFSHHKRMGWILLVLAIIIVVARVAAGVHYPSDIVGGSILGLISAMIIHRYRARIFRTIYNK